MAHKTLRLCAQVAEIVGLLIANIGDEAGVAGLHVVAVRPAPDASRLLISVAVSDDKTIETASILDQMKRHSGRLRAEVAGGITRRKAPSLAFEVVASTPPARSDG